MQPVTLCVAVAQSPAARELADADAFSLKANPALREVVAVAQVRFAGGLSLQNLAAIWLIISFYILEWMRSPQSAIVLRETVSWSRPVDIHIDACVCMDLRRWTSAQVEDGAVLELAIRLPPAWPLKPADVECRRKVRTMTAALYGPQLHTHYNTSPSLAQASASARSYVCTEPHV